MSLSISAISVQRANEPHSSEQDQSVGDYSLYGEALKFYCGVRRMHSLEGTAGSRRATYKSSTASGDTDEAPTGFSSRRESASRSRSDKAFSMCAQSLSRADPSERLATLTIHRSVACFTNSSSIASRASPFSFSRVRYVVLRNSSITRPNWRRRASTSSSSPRCSWLRAGEGNCSTGLGLCVSYAFLIAGTPSRILTNGFLAAQFAGPVSGYDSRPSVTGKCKCKKIAKLRQSERSSRLQPLRFQRDLCDIESVGFLDWKYFPNCLVCSGTKQIFRGTTRLNNGRRSRGIPVEAIFAKVVGPFIPSET